MNCPTCFISYSWDSDSHKKWVGQFASILNSFGIGVILDQTSDLLGEDMAEYMSENVKKADRIIVICTPNYKEKRINGAAFEKMLMACKMQQEPFANLFIPILRAGTYETSVPDFLKSKYCEDMRKNGVDKKTVEKIANSMKKKHHFDVNHSRPLKENKIMTKSTQANVSSEKSVLSVQSLLLLGGIGIDGIKYIWEKDGRIVESVALNQCLNAHAAKTQNENDHISSYISSVSFGCMLSTSASQCTFCDTGANNFGGILSSDDIALQNIFMARYDTDCPSFPAVHGNKREFAYMGQGEPGFCYAQIRNSILLTDVAMEQIKNKVHRHIIYTCGISDFMPLLQDDIKRNTFKNRVSVHFSLHAAGDDRNFLMPVNRDYDYHDFIFQCQRLFDITNEKIGVGILMFNNFCQTKHRSKSARKYTLDAKNLANILQELKHPNIFKIELCNLNKTSSGTQTPLSNEMAHNLLKVVEEHGFDCKIFSSFGNDNNSGCGMLKSKKGNQKPGVKTNEQYQASLLLLKEAKGKLV